MVSCFLAALAIGSFADPTEILIVLNKAEDTVSLVDTTGGKTIKTIPTGHGPNEVMVSPDGKFATVANMGSGQKRDKTITVLEMPEGKVVRTIDLGEFQRPHGMAFLSNTRMVTTTHEPEALHVINVAEGKVEKSILSPAKGLHMVVLSPDKKMAYGSCVFDQKMVAFDLVKGEVAYQLTCGNRAEGISISADGRTVAMGNVGEETVTLIDTVKKTSFKTLTGCPAPIRTFFADSDKLMFVSAAGTGEVVVFKTADWTEKKRIVLSDLPGVAKPAQGDRHVPMNFALSKDGKRLFVVLVTADAVAEIDIATLKVTRTHKSGKLPDGIAIWTKS